MQTTITMFAQNQIESVIRSNYKFDKIRMVKRIQGGYSKYTYEIILDENSFIFQIWNKPVERDETVIIYENDYLYPGGIENYCHINTILSDLKIRTPEVLFIDDSKSIIPFTCSLSQYIEIDSFNGFEEHMKRGTDKKVLEEFGDSFAKLKKYSRNVAGTFRNELLINPLEVAFSFAREHLQRSSGINYFNRNGEVVLDRLHELKSRLRQRCVYHLIHCDFKPDNFRFDKEGNIYWIDFESIQFFDIEYEMSQFVIPEFINTNCEYFLNSYKNGLQIILDYDRLTYYKIIRCITQIYNCSISIRNNENGIELSQAVIDSDLSTLNNMLNNKSEW